MQNVLNSYIYIIRHFAHRSDNDRLLIQKITFPNLFLGQVTKRPNLAKQSLVGKVALLNKRPNNR